MLEGKTEEWSQELGVSIMGGGLITLCGVELGKIPQKTNGKELCCFNHAIKVKHL